MFARIARVNSSINAFVALDEEAALRDAHASEARWQVGAQKSALDGVSFSVKDLLHARGFSTRFGSRTTTTDRAETDAPAVARLREAGAVLLGKTTTSEFGLRGAGQSPLTGTTRNPWDTRHDSGGSSAGAVAATAAGLCTFAIGTDGGGSIRVPSAYSGVVGLKPSWGVVATDPPWLVGAPPLVGPIARNVEDVTRVLAIIAAPDLRDPFRLTMREARDVTASGWLRGVRIAFTASLVEGRSDADVDPEMLLACARAVDLLRASGATLDASSPRLKDPDSTLRKLFSARAASTLASLSPDARALVDRTVVASAELGDRMSALEYLAAERERIDIVRTMGHFHQRYDLLLTPTSARVAPRIGEAPAATASFAAPFSLTRQPALSMPCGRTGQGLPIGLQLVGRHGEEELVLRAARVLERALDTGAPPICAPRAGSEH